MATEDTILGLTEELARRLDELKSHLVSEITPAPPTPKVEDQSEASTNILDQIICTTRNSLGCTDSISEFLAREVFPKIK